MRTAATRTILGCGLCFAAHTGLAAQQATAPDPSAVAMTSPRVVSSHPIAGVFTVGEIADDGAAAVRIGSARLVGSVAGFVVGAAATYAILHRGGSTSRCDRSANQDAWSSGQCAAAVVAGGAAGAVVGIVLGGVLGAREHQLFPGGRLGFERATDGGVSTFVRFTATAR